MTSRICLLFLVISLPFFVSFMGKTMLSFYFASLCDKSLCPTFTYIFLTILCIAFVNSVKFSAIKSSTGTGLHSCHPSLYYMAEPISKKKQNSDWLNFSRQVRILQYGLLKMCKRDLL